jgi:hypothetical protein
MKGKIKLMKDRSTIFITILAVLACFGLFSRAQASPDPTLPFASNTADGANALFFYPGSGTGGFNSAFGWFSGAFNTSAFFNTSIGAASLDLNNGTSNTAAGTGTLMLNIAADNNTAVGTLALQLNDFTATSPPTAEDNTAVGFQALWMNHDGGSNTAVGSGALTLNDSVGTNPATAFDNTAVGTSALFSNVDGALNTAVGFNAMVNNDLGNPGPGSIANGNTAVGVAALAGDPVVGNTGAANNAIGLDALFSNQTGNANQAMGAGALGLNTTGSNNVAIGHIALLNNNASNLTAVGSGALSSNHASFSNTAVGADALANNDSSGNTSGNGNTAVGFRALETNIDAGGNTALGFAALTGNDSSGLGLADDNTAVGHRALSVLVDGAHNVAVGDDAGGAYNTNESGNIVIGSGNFGVAGEDNVIRIGSNLPSNGINISDASAGLSAFTIGSGFTGGGIQYLQLLLGESVAIAPNFSTTNGASHCIIGGIFNQTPLAGSHGVVVAPNGTLADVTLSSRRFKKDIAPIDKISEGILALKPVTFHWKTDNTNEPEFGLVAEEVAEVNPAWATRDSQGVISGVRYDAIPILLLNEFLKEHKKVEQQQASISQLKSEMQTMVAQLKEQAAQIQKVSAQLEMQKPPTKVVVSEP